MSGELVVHFNQSPWPLASGVERAASLAYDGSKTHFVFAGHAVPERGLFLPVPRTVSRLLRVELPEIQSAMTGNLTLTSLPSYRRSQGSGFMIAGWPLFARNPSWASLQELVVDGLPAGRAVANYLVRRAGTRQLDLSRLHSRIRFLLFSYAQASRLVARLISERDPDRVHAYQGNWLNDRAVLDVAEAIDLPQATYGEVAPGKYWHWDRDPYKMMSWRDLDVWRQWCTATEGLTVAEKQQIIDELVRDHSSPRINPFSTFGQRDLRFTAPSRGYIAFFTANSNDERFGLDSNWDPFWPDQVDFASQLGATLASRGCHLVVRVHPNTANKPDCEQRPWTDLARRAEAGLVSGLTVVPATSPLDSYELARNATASVTWGSNISIELVARGLKAINVAPAIFDSVGAVPLCTSFESLVYEIDQPLVSENQREKAAAWLWFMRDRWSKDFRNVTWGRYDDQPAYQGHVLAASKLATGLSRPWSKIRSQEAVARIMLRRYAVGPQLT